MQEETSMFQKPLPEAKLKESQAFNISVRGWVCIMIVTTICFMSIMGQDVKEPLYTLGGLVIGYYFGQKKQEGQK